jgi:hypothetical protein
MIFQKLVQNKYKRKRGKPLRKPLREVLFPVLQVRGGKISGFRVQGGNVNSGYSLER